MSQFKEKLVKAEDAVNDFYGAKLSAISGLP